MSEYTSREMPSRFLGPGFFGGGLDVVAGEGAGTERIDLISDMDAPAMMSRVEGGGGEGRREVGVWRQGQSGMAVKNRCRHAPRPHRRGLAIPETRLSDFIVLERCLSCFTLSPSTL